MPVEVTTALFDVPVSKAVDVVTRRDREVNNQLAKVSLFLPHHLFTHSSCTSDTQRNSLMRIVRAGGAFTTEKLERLLESRSRKKSCFRSVTNKYHRGEYKKQVLLLASGRLGCIPKRALWSHRSDRDNTSSVSVNEEVAILNSQLIPSSERQSAASEKNEDRSIPLIMKKIQLLPR